MKTRTSKTRITTKSRRGAPKVKRRAARAAEDNVGQSVVKQKYRDRYEDGSCGDHLARKLRRHLKTDGGTIDLAKLRQLAKRNNVWASRYASLNPGLARMIVANRFRKLVRAGSAIDWG